MGLCVCVGLRVCVGLSLSVCVCVCVCTCGIGMSQPFGYTERPTDMIIITSTHILTHCHTARRQRATQAGSQTDRLA